MTRPIQNIRKKKKKKKTTLIQQNDATVSLGELSPRAVVIDPPGSMNRRTGGIAPHVQPARIQPLEMTITSHRHATHSRIKAPCPIAEPILFIIGTANKELVNEHPSPKLAGY